MFNPETKDLLEELVLILLEEKRGNYCPWARNHRMEVAQELVAAPTGSDKLYMFCLVVMVSNFTLPEIEPARRRPRD